MSSEMKRKKRQLLARDGIRRSIDGIQWEWIWRCYLCGEEFPPHKLEIEHKLPISRGGRNNLDNLGLACVDCNTDKADMTEEEYREFRELLAKYKPTDVDVARSGFMKYSGRKRLTKAKVVLSHALSDYWPHEEAEDDKS